MKISNSEKLILVMLCEIYEKLGIGKEGEIDPEFIKSAIYSENTWGLEWKYHGLFSSTSDTPAEVTEVVNFLDMWSFLEESHEKLAQSDKDKLIEDGGVWAKSVKFRGFDGNNEGEYMGIARFLTKDLDRFSRFKDRNLNSHMPCVGTYRRMYEAFEPIRRNLMDRGLSLSEMTVVMKAAGR